jgi:hypothetical protein
MNEAGHFVFEALVGLIIAAVLMLGAQQLVTTGVQRQERIKQAYEEAEFLERAQACLPRFRLAQQSVARDATIIEAHCAGISLSEQAGETDNTRIITLSEMRNGRTFVARFRTMALEE